MSTVNVSVQSNELTKFQHKLVSQFMTYAIYAILENQHIFKKQKRFTITITVLKD